MKWWAAGAVSGVLIVATVASSRPAGACSIYCQGDDRELTGVRVRLVSGDAEAATPDWPETVEMRVQSWTGAPEELRLSDDEAVYVEVQP
ncbi:MAG: hypothetical protein H6735_32415 [Alphaproteobacteria bacterium]|nr:hypothetical protein [Alphaproteobacteria bacterium]